MNGNDGNAESKQPIIIVATRNRGKLEEIKQLLAEFPCRVVSMDEAGIDWDIEESGSTFEENALIKAGSIRKVAGGIVLADDSGLEVDFLGGAPGVHSARYAGAGATDEDRNKKLLDALSGVPAEKRTARFVCAVAVLFPSGRSITATGSCEGYIAFKPEGSNGFGYDPLFYLPEYGMTMAQIDSNLKNHISHRGKAMRKLLEEFRKAWKEESPGDLA